jgi:hypothetical protein
MAWQATPAFAYNYIITSGTRGRDIAANPGKTP